MHIFRLILLPLLPILGSAFQNVATAQTLPPGGPSSSTTCEASLSPNIVPVSESAGTASVVVVINDVDCEAPITLNTALFANFTNYNVTYSLNPGTATIPADFTGSGGNLTSVTRGANLNISVPIVNDSVFEPLPDEDFQIELTSAEACFDTFNFSDSVQVSVPVCIDLDISADPTATVIIADNDPPPPPVITPPTVEITAATSTLSILEGGSDSVDIQITANPSGMSSCRVDFATSDGSASAPGDYNAISNTNVTIAAGQTTSVPITSNTDSLTEGPENFDFNLLPASVAGAIPACIIGSSNDSDISITDDPLQPGTIQFTFSAITVDEDDGSVVLTVTRTGGSDGAISAIVNTDAGSATLGSDYTNTTQLLQWAAGDSSNRTVPIPIAFDTVSENDEFFTVNLMDGTPNDSIIASPATVTVTINDVFNGIPGTLQFAQPSYTVDEDAGVVTIDVTRTGGSDGAVSVTYDTDQGSAGFNIDYVNTSGTLNWSDGDVLPRSFTVEIIEDDIDENDEQFTVTLQNAQPVGDSVQIGTPALTTVTINNVNPPAPEPAPEPEPAPVPAPAPEPEPASVPAPVPAPVSRRQ